MRVLLTGFVGYPVAALLIEQRHQVSGLSRCRASAAEKLRTHVTSVIDYASTAQRSPGVYLGDTMTISSCESAPEGGPTLGRFILQRSNDRCYITGHETESVKILTTTQARRGRALERTPNDKFRDARERTQSAAHTDECLSRQEVADKANAWIWEHHGKKYESNANYIGKLEQGVIRWPNVLCREAFRVILGVSKDSELGFVNSRARSRRAVVKLEDVKRRKFFETTVVSCN